ncbi:MAG: hypothetical protein IJM18_06890 [Clostridia bacterium]|nr:hypothetical protein [Clostridia bacterium]
MAGVLLHWAMGDPQILDPDDTAYGASHKKAYALGLLLPDIAKQDLIAGREDFERFFEGCSSADIMAYDEYLRFKGNHHFNPDARDPSQQDTRDPKLEDFLSAGYTDPKKAVWAGVLCHLMGDKTFYYGSYCVEDERAMEDYRREVGEIGVWDRNRWKSSATGRTYYEDYDVLNKRIDDEYRVLDRMRRILPEPLLNELLECFSVGFSASRMEPVYMNLGNIRRCIAFSHELCRCIAEGKTEEALSRFGEGGPELEITNN